MGDLIAAFFAAASALPGATSSKDKEKWSFGLTESSPKIGTVTGEEGWISGSTDLASGFRLGES